MKVYLLSLGAGLLVGVVYSLLNVRSPAPPLVALVGLLGILIGEQVIPVGKQMLSGAGLAAAWQQGQVRHRTSSACCPAARPKRNRHASPMPLPEIRIHELPRADLILHRGLFTTLDRAQPDRQRGRDQGRHVHRRRARQGGDGARRPVDQGHRPQGPARAARPDRQPPAHHPRRAQLQHGAALGRRAQPRRRDGDAEAAGRRSRRRRNGCAWSAASPSISSPRSACRPSTSSTPSRPTRRSSSCTSTTARCSTPPRCARSATPRTRPNPPGGEIVRDAHGNPTGLLLAKPNAGILYATLAKGPKLPFEYQLNSTRHFMRELNRLGVTGAIDAGGGFQNYPEDYAVIQKLADDGQLTVRLAYNLFTQKPKGEKDDFLNWTKTSKYKQGDDYFRHNGAGEMLVFSAADFEDFREPRPDMPPEMEGELEEVVRILAQNRWPWRLHATYDETICARARRVRAGEPGHPARRPATGSSTTPRRSPSSSIDRIAALGGGIAVQHRMAYQGEYFVERYGAGAAEATPPIAQDAGEGREGLGRHRRDARRLLQSLGVAGLAGHRPDRRRPAALPAAQLPRPRDGAADVDRERHLVLQRGRQEGPDRGRPARRPDRARPRLLLLRRETRSPTRRPS